MSIANPLVSVPMSPRIITLTLNPALDLAAEADEVVPTHEVACTTSMPTLAVAA